MSPNEIKMDCLFHETKCLGSYRPGRGTRNEEIKVPRPTALIKVSKQDVSCCVCARPVGQAGGDEPPLLPVYLIILFNTGVLG